MPTAHGLEPHRVWSLSVCHDIWHGRESDIVIQLSSSTRKTMVRPVSHPGPAPSFLRGEARASAKPKDDGVHYREEPAARTFLPDGQALRQTEGSRFGRWGGSRPVPLSIRRNRFLLNFFRPISWSCHHPPTPKRVLINNSFRLAHLSQDSRHLKPREATKGIGGN